MRLTQEQQDHVEELARPITSYIIELRKAEVTEIQAMTEDERELQCYSYDDNELGQVARSLARLLLEAAEVNGLGGCLLCQG